MKEQARITVHGHVQGVAFRAYTVRTARMLGLRGYVRNLSGGEVEIVAAGERALLDRLIEWARRGSPASDVTDVEVEMEPPSIETGDFRIEF
jgi:acylphosphatase